MAALDPVHPVDPERPLLAHCMRQLITLTRAVGTDDTSDAGAVIEEVQR
jgi:hypothetical protein